VSAAWDLLSLAPLPAIDPDALRPFCTSGCRTDQAALKPITVKLPIESPKTRSNASETRRAGWADEQWRVERDAASLYAQYLSFWNEEPAVQTSAEAAAPDTDVVEGGPVAPGSRRLLQSSADALRSQYVFWLDKQTVTWYPLCDSKRNVSDASVYAAVPVDVLNGLQFNPTVLCKDSVTEAGFCDAVGGMLMLQTAPDSLCERPATTPLPVSSSALPVWQVCVRACVSVISLARALALAL